MKSRIPEELMNAYLDTDYIVSDDPPLLLRIGEASDDARIMLASLGVSTAAFMTAWNPRSELLSDSDNDDRQANLLSEIEMRRLNYLVGYAEREDWREYSYLILGISRDEATALAGQFEQNAYVWLPDNGIPELTCLV